MAACQTKRTSRPDWDAIKKYVGGQILDERKRTKRAWSDALVTETTARLEQMFELSKQIELVALEVPKLREEMRSCRN